MTTQPRRRNRFPLWVSLSLLGNVICLLSLSFLLLKGKPLPSVPQANASSETRNPPPSPQLGPRHQLTYDQWVELLGREAQVAADKRSRRLTILLGDSLSLWFPPQLLPTDRTWLNQGISGETSAGLFRRLDLFDRTKPETIFLLIGINDLIRGVDDQTILQNQERIIRYLKRTHPQTQIVVQSLLPHAAAGAKWEGRDRLQGTPNSRIRNLNRELAAITRAADVYYLDLHSLFTDPKGNLLPELTSDGLHLSLQGYWVWRSALQTFSQLELEQAKR
ncbi:MAG: SGNH/GDSL hydrolase family protein [Leptolyngbyaceae cyanobacterium bins.59]|nr:SGNH/GDSL hydrolase family protein [Leptolyngbyaceae cyanobacterium bins.59]